jgi:hypothetical protein
MALKKRHNKSSINKSSKKNKELMIKKSLSKGYNVAKTTTKKYAPKVKAGLETVGSEVKVVAKKSVPLIKTAADKLLGLINKTRKNLKMKA